MKTIKKVCLMQKLFLLLLVFIISSCNPRKEVPVTLKSAEIVGDMSEYFTIVDNQYSIVKEKGKDCFRINIEIKRTDKEFDFKYDIADLASRGYLKISCDLFGENNQPTFIAENVYGSEDFDENDIIKLQPGTTGWLEFSWCRKQDEIMKTKTIAFKSYIDEGGIPQKINSYSDDSQSTTTQYSSKSSGTTNWNSILDSYESYVDKYIKLLKKANEGDMSAMTEYVNMLEKAEELSEKLENADDDLTTAQAQRFLKIQTKLLEAAASGL